MGSSRAGSSWLPCSPHAPSVHQVLSSPAGLVFKPQEQAPGTARHAWLLCHPEALALQCFCSLSWLMCSALVVAAVNIAAAAASAVATAVATAVAAAVTTAVTYLHSA